MNKNIIITVVVSVMITMILMNKKEKEDEKTLIISSPFYNPYPYYGHPSYYSGHRRRHRMHGGRRH